MLHNKYSICKQSSVTFALIMCFEVAFAYDFVEFSMIYPCIAVISVGKSRTTETGNRTICFDCFMYGSMGEKKCKYFLIWPQKRYFFVNRSFTNL